MILLCCTASFRNNTSSSLLRAAATTTTMTTMTTMSSSRSSSSLFSLSTSSSSSLSLLLSSSLKATTTTNLGFSTMITDTDTDITDISNDISNDESNNKSKSKKSKYYTIGITGSTGLIGTALQNELMSLNNNGSSSSSSSKGKGIGEGIGNGVNGKPVRIITFKRGQKAEIINNPNTFFNDDTFTFKKSITWNPYANHNDDNNSNNNSADTDNIANNNDNNNNIAIDTTIIKNLDAIIHLSGENISTGEQGMLFASLGIRPWTISKKQKIINSRIITTSVLATAISKSGNTKCVFLCASGIGVYGNDYYKIDNNNNNNINDNENEKEPADETMDITKTKGFLPEVSRLWEAASKILVSVSSSKPEALSLLESEQDQSTSTSTSTSTTNNRVCQLRNGVVLSKLGGALGKLYPIFYLGGGGIGKYQSTRVRVPVQ
jgi:NAD dependent epimerase/dehydratase family enzyme